MPVTPIEDPEVGVTIVLRESRSGTGVSVGGGWVFGGSEEIGGGDAGGHPDFGMLPPPDAGGIAPPDTGETSGEPPPAVVRLPGVDTTIVYRRSGSTRGPSVGGGGISVEIGTRSGTAASAATPAPGGTTPAMGSMPVIVFPPGTIRFVQNDRWWMSECLETRLAYKVSGIVVSTPVRIGVRAFVARDGGPGGTPVDILRAQLGTSIAAAEAARIVLRDLDNLVLSAALVPDRFRELMNGAYASILFNAHVESC